MTHEHIITLDQPDKTVSGDSSSVLSSAPTEADLNELEKKPSSNEKKESSIIYQEKPEDRYGWFVVLGAFLVQVTSFGTCTSVMQDYFQQHSFTDQTNSTVNLSFVGTIAMVSLNASGPLVQILISMCGMRFVLCLGTFLVSFGLQMASLSKQIWHLYLTQGIIFGLGASCVYMAIMSAAPLWFNKRRGLALGIIASGSGIGGLIFPFIMTSINSKLGFAWTYRVVGFICLVCDGIACITVKEKKDPDAPPKPRKKLSKILDFSVLKNRDFLLYCLASNIGLFGYFVPYFFLPSYATYLGLTDSQGSALVAVSSACNFVGRIIMGFMADRIGKINTNLLCHTITALSCFLIWTFAETYGSLMGFAVVFGLTSGCYFALLSPTTAAILGFDQFPSGLSFLLVTNLIPVFGPNIASAIESGVDAAPFLSYKMFAGAAYTIAAILLAVLKFKMNSKLFSFV